jgi:hypothetical protein
MRTTPRARPLCQGRNIFFFAQICFRPLTCKLHAFGTCMHTRTHAHAHRRIQTHRHTDAQAHRHTGAQTRRHTDTQTHRHTRGTTSHCWRWKHTNPRHPQTARLQERGLLKSEASERGGKRGYAARPRRERIGDMKKVLRASVCTYICLYNIYIHTHTHTHTNTQIYYT